MWGSGICRLRAADTLRGRWAGLGTRGEVREEGGRPGPGAVAGGPGMVLSAVAKAGGSQGVEVNLELLGPAGAMTLRA